MHLIFSNLQIFFMIDQIKHASLENIIITIILFDFSSYIFQMSVAYQSFLEIYTLNVEVKLCKIKCLLPRPTLIVINI